MGDCESSTVNGMTVSSAAWRAVSSVIRGGELSMSNGALSRIPARAVPGAFDRASVATIRTTYVPSGVDVVSHAKIESRVAFVRTAQSAPDSNRYNRSNWRSSLLSSRAVQTKL